MTREPIRTYTELSTLHTFEERYEYLKLSGTVGKETFGRDRWLNQLFYTRPDWQRIRREVVLRDHGCDLGVPGYEFSKGVIVVIHHMNPIQLEDLLDQNRIEFCLSPEYLISTCIATHNGIHFGKGLTAPVEVLDRFPNDTSPWRR